jgi:hypothetical protein
LLLLEREVDLLVQLLQDLDHDGLQLLLALRAA